MGKKKSNKKSQTKVITVTKGHEQKAKNNQIKHNTISNSSKPSLLINDNYVDSSVVDTTKTIKSNANKNNNSNSNSSGCYNNIEIESSSSLWSKSKKKKMRKIRGFHNKQQQRQYDDINSLLTTTTTTITSNNNNPKKKPKIKKLSIDKEKKSMFSTANIQQQDDEYVVTNDRGKNNTKNQKSSNSSGSTLLATYKKQLQGARFRKLNEDLYTKSSNESYEIISKNPTLFQQYHEGFRNQVKSWPQNPVDIILQSILSYCDNNINRTKKNKKKHSINNDTTYCLTIADFGCGEAKIASTITKSKKYSKLIKVHSFDFVTNNNDLITQADMSNVPLSNNTVDIGIICLALMGTNIPDFIREAYRVLKPSTGLLKIAEVRSRFESSTNDDDDDDGIDSSLLKEFLKCMSLLGFKCKHVNRSNKMFFIMDFIKLEHVKPSMDVQFTAKPCIYKRR